MAYLAGTYVLVMTAIVCAMIFDCLNEREHQKHLEHVWMERDEAQKQCTTEFELAHQAGQAKPESGGRGEGARRTSQA